MRSKTLTFASQAARGFSSVFVKKPYHSPHRTPPHLTPVNPSTPHPSIHTPHPSPHTPHPSPHILTPHSHPTPVNAHPSHHPDPSFPHPTPSGPQPPPRTPDPRLPTLVQNGKTTQNGKINNVSARYCSESREVSCAKPVINK